MSRYEHGSVRERDLCAVRGAVCGAGASVGARQGAACGAVFGAVCGTARGAGIRTELAVEIPELAADSAANLGISAANSVRVQGTPHRTSTRTELAAEIPEFLPLIWEFLPLIRYGYRVRCAARVPVPN